MNFLAPLFFAGMALIAIPWFVHRIRRPEREVVRFSSLMFVPDFRREVIERQRIQHPWLMLLRMLLLVMLALAFTRPYQKQLLQAQPPEHVPAIHVILLDTSLSMQAKGVMEEAKSRAEAILRSLPPNERVGVVTFARSAQVLLPLLDPGHPAAGSRTEARRVIDAVRATWESTDYRAGLQLAQEQLMSWTGEDVRRIVHLISDFQVSGMPREAGGWRLSQAIELDPIPIGGDLANDSVETLAIQSVGGPSENSHSLQVRARVKQWTGKRTDPRRIELVIGDQTVESKTLALLPGHASQVSFLFSWDGESPLGGYVSVSADDLPADDRRYFAWNPRPRPRILLLRERERTKRWSYDRLIETALSGDPDLPWRIESTSELDMADVQDAALIILGNLRSGDATRLKDYVARGGKLLLLPHRGTDPETLNLLLAGENVELGRPRFGKVMESQFESLAWVDLGHRIFQPFRGARYNDFSPIRYHNYFLLRSLGTSKVIARFENGDPAMVDLAIRKGRAVIWTGGIELDWTNLARRPRFIPLLYETLNDLAGEYREKVDYLVGENTAELAGLQPVTVAEPSAQPRDAHGFLVPGLFRWQDPDHGERLMAVNVAAEESDLTPSSIPEFQIRLCDAPGGTENTADETGTGPQVIRREMGRWVLATALGLLVLESIYAVRLRGRGEGSP